MRQTIRLVLLATVLTGIAGSAMADLYWSGTIGGDVLMTKAAGNHIVRSTLVISKTGTLTIEPGARVYFDAGAGIDVAEGKLIADASGGQAITFGFNGVPAPNGAWSGIVIRGAWLAPASVIKNVAIWYGGKAGGAALTLESDGPQISDVIIRNSAGAGIKVNNGKPTLTAITVEDCTGDGILVSSGSGSPTTLTGGTILQRNGQGLNLTSYAKVNLESVTIQNNSGYAIGMEPGTSISSITSLTVTGNGVPPGTKNAIGYRGGTLTMPETWPIYPNLQWHILGTTTVSTVAAATLTIPTGQTIYFAPNAYLDVAGKITANGVTFTSIQAAPGVGPVQAPVITATGTASSITVTWPAITGVTSFEIHRKDSAAAAWALRQTVATNSYTDTAVIASRTYLYKVIANVGGSKSPDSNYDLATTITYTDPALASGAVPIKAKHLIEVRTAVNAICTFAGTSNCAALPFTGTALDEAATKTKGFKASDVSAVQSQIVSLRTKVGAIAAVFREAAAAGAPVRRIHMEDLRTGAN